MKLPEELKDSVNSGYWQRYPASVEAIVRDCARFADGNEEAILARYGLTEECGE